MLDRKTKKEIRRNEIFLKKPPTPFEPKFYIQEECREETIKVK